MTPHLPVPEDAIVAAVDGSSEGYAALRWAAHQARLERRELLVVHALNLAPIGTTAAELWDAMEADARRVVHQAVGKAGRREPGLEPVPLIRRGDPRSVLLDLSRHAHLMVLGARGRSRIERLLMGSVSSAVARHADCPVVIHRGDGDDLGRGVMVGVGTPIESRPEVEFAFAMADLRGLPLTVVHCFFAAGDEPVSTDTPGMEDLRMLLDEAVAGLCERYPDVKVKQRLARGLVDRTLVEESRGMDLVVVGRHPHRSILGLLEPGVAGTLITHAPAAVAMVPR